MAEPALVLSGVSLFYGRRQILTSVSLEVDQGQSVAIMGKTGTGKSSLLAGICGLVQPAGGEILVMGHSVPRMRGRKIARFRREHLGVVFQFGELLPALTAVENVALPAMINDLSWAQAQARALALLDSLEVHVADVPAMALSGGERTRVAIGRAMINEPDVLLADEPTGALDAETRDSVRDLLYEIPRQRRCALVVVTHDPAVASGADRILRLENAQLVTLPAGAVAE